MRRVIARLLALALAVCFFGSFALIYVNPDAILVALGMFIASLVLWPLCIAVAVTGPRRPLPWDNETTETITANRQYHEHAAAAELDCDSCGVTIAQGDPFYVLWDYDDVLGHWSDTDAPRLCSHCTSIREHADALGLDGVSEAFSRGRVDEVDRDEMVDYLLTQDHL